jgi:signal transduction histidine kinase
MPKTESSVARLATSRPATMITLLWFIVAALNVAVALIGGFDTTAAAKVTMTSLCGFGLSLLAYLATRRMVVAAPSSLLMVVAIAIAAGTALWAFDVVVQAWGEWRWENASRLPSYFFGLRYNWVYFIVLFLLQAAVSALLVSAKILQTREQQLVDARLAALRLQLNPHFLFNTLNAIETLVAEARVTQAEEMITRLSDFLRASLSVDPADLVALAQELDTIQAYLNIESVRFGDRLEVQYACEPGLAEAQVPSMILQPVIENAVKYAVAPSKDRVTVSIEARRDNDDLVLVVEDNGKHRAGAVSTPGAGVGLRNVGERLATLYGVRANIEAVKRTRGFTVVIRLPLRRSAD